MARHIRTYIYLLLLLYTYVDYLLEQFITTAVPLIHVQWRVVADYLDYPPIVVQKIDQEWSESIQCCKELFINWYNSDNGVQPCSWEALIAALRHKRFGNVSNYIEKELLKKLGISMYVGNHVLHNCYC